MKYIESTSLNSLEDLEKFYSDLKNSVDSFDICDFYESTNAKALMIITPRQFIVVPVWLHGTARSFLYSFLYGKDYNREFIHNIVVLLDSYTDNLFIPYFPSSINQFQSDVFSRYFEQLEPYSEVIRFCSPNSFFEGNFEEAKENFSSIPIDDDFVPCKETIISYTAEEMRENMNKTCFL